MSSQVVDIVDVSAPKGRASSMMFSGWLRLYNHSIYGLQVTFSDGEAFYIPPQNRRTICLNQPATYFDWVQVLSFDVGAGTPVSSMMVIETLELSDVKLEGDLHLMGGVQNVGNTVPIGGSVSNVANDGNPPATEFVEASQSSTKRVSITNDGYMMLAQLLGGLNKIMQEWISLDATAKDWALIIRQTDGALFFQDRTDNKTLLVMLPTGAVQLDNGAIFTDGAGKITLNPGFLVTKRTVAGETVYAQQQIASDSHVWEQRIFATDKSYDFHEQVSNVVPLRLLIDGSVQFAGNAASVTGTGSFEGSFCQVFVNTTSADQATYDMTDSKAGGKDWQIVMKQDGSLYIRDVTDSATPLALSSSGVTVAGASTNVPIWGNSGANGVKVFEQSATPTAGTKGNIWIQPPFTFP